MNTKRILNVVVVTFVVAIGAWWQGTIQQSAPTLEVGSGAIESAFAQRRSDIQVSASGQIVKVLSDDKQGSRHQRLIVELDSGHSVLIAHNIDVAKRVKGVLEGQQLAFFGEYEWNEKGGVVHWTHRDLKGQHVDGWLEYKGERYQ